MTEKESNPKGIKKGKVITIGSEGKPVDPNSLAVDAARIIAQETGTTVIVTDITEGIGEDPDGRPIKIDPASGPSNN